MPKLCDRKNCTGCYACSNICPKQAIEMKEDEYGYVYPLIDNEKCVECKLCEKTCPYINKIELKYPTKCYAARVKETEILKASTSGGIATILAKKIIEKNGVVYGAAYTEDCEVNHIRVNKTEELSKLQGSKYVHSYIKESFKLAKQDLINGKIVLFIGTPCQVAGLKNFLMKEYENLYTVDIICHGVPSQKFLKEEVRRVNGNSTKIDRINFRDKTHKDFTFLVKKQNKVLYAQDWIDNPYFYTFMKSITYRENCYGCLYARPERVSDITIGDFWGLNEESKFYNTKDNGISVVLQITNKGKELFDMVTDEVDIEERPIEEAVSGNDQLKEPSVKSREVDKFKKIYYQNGNFYKTYKKLFIKHIYKQKLKSNPIIYNIVRKIKGDKNGKK